MWGEVQGIFFVFLYNVIEIDPGFAGGDQEAAEIVHSKLQGWIYHEGFTPYPDARNRPVRSDVCIRH